ncbi:protein distal antenna-related [Drosophila grimshawi]|uniref:GH18050 n=1 Tax=Drosophila grimshawi TaxID=7222 RepID=B4JHP1_DROGR|nr:protein distal antenna-related [Drosophila grimshawi]EDV93880.1 GH18050 [Drosophila grimshawi]
MDISAYQHMNIRMSTRGKRPLRNLTPNDKVRAIQRIHNGETKASVSRDIGVPESTLRGWCKNEQKLRFMCRQLGTDSMPGLASPPEKRAKFELQLLPPKFATMPIGNYEELAAFGSSQFYASHNEALLEKLALVEFNKIKHINNGLHPSEVVTGTATGTGDDTDAVSPVMGCYSTNNMVQQLNLLALFNSKLSPGIHNRPKYSETQTQPAAFEESKQFNCPLLSVKNWARDPAKQQQIPANSTQTQYVNDSNNNDCPITLTPTATPTPDVTGQSLQLTEDNAAGMLQQATFATAPATDLDGQGGALLDWCKMFSASLNFFAFAAAAASMHPTAELLVPQRTLNEGTHDLKRSFSHASVHSESSKESFDDSEPEDLSVRWCTSKVSSPANSRSQSPDKNSTSSSTSIPSDAEQ